MARATSSCGKRGFVYVFKIRRPHVWRLRYFLIVSEKHILFLLVYSGARSWWWLDFFFWYTVVLEVSGGYLFVSYKESLMANYT